MARRRLVSCVLFAACAAACGPAEPAGEASGSAGGAENPPAGAPSGSGGSGAPGGGGSGGAGGSASGGGGSGGGGSERLADFALGPYPSAHAMLVASVEKQAGLLDATKKYGQAPAQGYVIQAVARYLDATRGLELPGGEGERDHLAEIALGEAEELLAAGGEVITGGPGWGLDYAWDAFGDGSENPAFTEYAWQTGLVVRSFLDLAAYLKSEPARMAAFAARADELVAVSRGILDAWHGAYSTLASVGKPEWGYYWYSRDPNDAIAVFNTTALLSMAEMRLAELTGEAKYAARPLETFAYLRDAGLEHVPASDAYTWNYAEHGYPATKKAEDSSHASLTLQWLREGFARGLIGATDAKRVQRTLLEVMFKGNPAKIAFRVDGTSTEADWKVSAASAIGASVWGDALPASEGGLVDVWELARNVLVSGYLARHDVKVGAPSVSASNLLTLAHLFAHRPAELSPDSTWVAAAGAPEEEAPKAGGGVRFHSKDWSEPAPLGAPSLPGQAGVVVRRATAPNANLLVDLPAEAEVIVSITYRSAEGGSVDQYDGSEYVTLAPLPASSVPNQTEPVLFRTSFRLRADRLADYQESVSGTNVLLRLTPPGVEVHRIEATPLGP